MSDQNKRPPRVIIVRHGETEWAKEGRFTGTTDIDLTDVGVAQVSSTAETFVGTGNVIEPSRLASIFVSPRKRAQHTFEILLHQYASVGKAKVIRTEDIAEWDYGDYEGLTDQQTRELRSKRGHDEDKKQPWSVWRHGCEGGETPVQVTRRLDNLISEIKEIQRPYMNGEGPGDVLIVAHGLILRCLWLRWQGLSLDSNILTIMDPGEMAILRYKNNDIGKPAYHLGVALPPSGIGG